MHTNYEYVFDREKCWYKDQCPEYNDPDACREICQFFLQMHYMFAHSNLPTKLHYPIHLKPDACDKDAFDQLMNLKDNIREFVEEGKSIYIHSPFVGNGKTSWAIKLMQRYFNEVWEYNCLRSRGVFLPVTWFLTMLKQTISRPNDYFDEIFKGLTKYDIVIWDDIASTKMSEYDYTILLTYIDHRLMNGKTNIFTGNLSSIDEMEDALGMRLASRIWYSDTRVKFRGKDRRNRE